MTTASVTEILDHAARTLEALMHRYGSLARAYETTDPGKAELAEFLCNREQTTIEALERYRDDAHSNALGTHVRFGVAFPYSTDDLELPEHPSLDELIELAQRTDALLEQLSERIQVYAASRQLFEILHAIEELVGGRRRQLSAVLQELERYEPSPKRSPE
ncbi:MAG: hypothetical protein R6X02_16565 [Enhygromyxa sp.]